MATWLLAAALALSPAPLPAGVLIEPEPPPPQQVLAVPEALRAHFQQYVKQGAVADHPQAAKLDRLVSYLFDKDGGLGLEYQYDANYTVAQSFQARKVNCLSFTLLAVALARDAGLDAYAQEIEDVLTWYQVGSTVYRNNHVNAGIRVGHQRFTMDVAWDDVITRNQPKAVSDQHLLALFYNNRAVVMLAAGQYPQAQAYLARSLQLDPDYPSFWNNAGVMALRGGDKAGAERAYLRALALNESDSPALFNLVSLYNRSQREDEARPLQRRLERIRARDPFDQFLMALERERTGDYAGAVSYYQRAIRLYNGEHRFYEALARVYLHLGDARRAGRALARARTLSAGETQARYQARLELLRRPQEPSLFGPRPR